jgi:dolichol-phosphate hexosyltransferase
VHSLALNGRVRLEATRHGDAGHEGAGEWGDVSVQFGEDSNASKPGISYSCTPASPLRALKPGIAGRSLSTEPVKRPTSAQTAMKLSILMPAYNEERTIIQAIDEVLSAEYPCDVELIVVDDGSTDGTPMLLDQVEDPRVRIHRHPINRGKGAAVLSAAAFATGTHALLFDADLEYSPDDISSMLAPVCKGRCSIVYGARVRGYNTVYRSYLYAAANRLLSRAANVLFNACLTDLHTCLKLVPLPLLRNLHLTETRFGLDTELTAVLLRLGARPFEVAVSYCARSRSEGKKITLRDAMISGWILLRVRLLSYRRLTHLELRSGADGNTGEGTSGLETQWMRQVTALSVNHDGNKVSASATG